jgi:hypothetical protein
VISRSLAWEGCLNVRDLGGLPTTGGGITRRGIVVRSDTVGRLTEAGWRAAQEYGVARIVDLRFSGEREPAAPAARPVETVHVSLLGEHDPTAEEEWRRRARATNDAVELHRWWYLGVLRRLSTNVARAVTAIAEVHTGCVLVHCQGGKDRTGIVSALLLSLAGVEDEVIAADYAESEARLPADQREWIDAAPDDDERMFRARLVLAPPAAMLDVLARLRSEWGGAQQYLRDAGVTTRDVRALRARLAG